MWVCRKLSTTTTSACIPAVDQLSVTLNKNVEVTVYNIMGQAVMTVEGRIGANTIDISNLTSGIYFISAGNDTQKFIVK